MHSGTNNVISVSSHEAAANEIVSIALTLKQKDHQITVSVNVPRRDRFSKKAKDVNNFFEVQRKDHYLNFVSH